jgi:hypothetical protein
MNEIRRCHHIKSNGLVCGSPALRGRAYCYYHHEAGIRERRRSLHNNINTSCIEFGNLETPEELQASLIDVLTALVQKRIDQNVAGKLLYGLQLAMRNLDSLCSADPRVYQAVDDLGPQPRTPEHDFDLLTDDRLADADRQLTDAMLHPSETLLAQVVAEYPDYHRGPKPTTPDPATELARSSNLPPRLPPTLTRQQKNAAFLARMRA